MLFYIKKLIKGLVSLVGLEIGRKGRFQPSFNLLDVVLEAVASSQNMLNIVQVGANDGSHGDPIHNFLIENKDRTNALLIEPQPEIIPYLQRAYVEHPRVSIFKGAIGESESLLLYRIRPDLWSSFHAPYLRQAPEYRAASGLTSASREHVMKAARKYLDRNVSAEEAVETIEVPCRRLADLMSSMAFPMDIHVLQVDAEGADDQVIYACDIGELQPVVINFESMNLDKGRLADLESFLSRKGYKIFRWSKSDTVAILGRGRLGCATSVPDLNIGKSTAT